MAEQSVFKRYELKYLLTQAQKQSLLAGMAPHMEPDRHGKTTVRNLYYDTDTYLLIRRSIEKPVYKEKLRIRTYHQVQPDDTVFVELKKKYRSVVYKRRISLSEADAAAWLDEGAACPRSTQISREIDYFREFYGALRPTVFLSYRREAYVAADGSDFRVTFDDTVLCRREDLSLRSEVYGTALLPEDTVLMEIKCAGGIPLWMTEMLSRERIYKTSFSKYGTAYQKLIYPQFCCANTKKQEVSI